MPELKLLFLQLIVILITARLMAAALRLVGQPEVVGEMVAGILLGPSLLGRISAATMNSLLPATGFGPLYALSQVGLVLFMFLVGLEVRAGAIRASAKSVIVASYASIVAPFLCGGILASKLYPHLGSGASRLPFVLFLGAAISVTAFSVLARILADHKLIVILNVGLDLHILSPTLFSMMVIMALAPTDDWPAHRSHPPLLRMIFRNMARPRNPALRKR